MAAREGQLESASCFQLTPDLGQIWTRICASAADEPTLLRAALCSDVTGELHSWRPAAGSAAPTLTQQDGGFGQRRSRRHIYAAGQPGFGQATGRHHDPPHSPPRQSHDHRQQARNRA